MYDLKCKFIMVCVSVSLITNNNYYLLKTVAVAVDLRKPVYGRVICKAIDYNQVLGIMAKVNWEVKDIMCEHSRYVDYFLQVSYIKKFLHTQI